MAKLCKSCDQFAAPFERGVYLCLGCTRILLAHLKNPRWGVGGVIRSSDYSTACKVCGEFENRRLVDHPEWGKICEVDVKEAAELYGLAK